MYSCLGMIKIKNYELNNILIHNKTWYTKYNTINLELFLNFIILLINYGYSQKYRLRGLGYKQNNFNGYLLQFKLRYSHVLFRYLSFNLITYNISKRRKFFTIYGLNKDIVNKYLMLLLSFRISNVYTKKGFFKRNKKVLFKKKKKKK